MRTKPIRPAVSRRALDAVRDMLGKEPRNLGPNTVRCYRCQHRFEVSRLARSTSCPCCYKPVMVEDLILKGNKPKLVMVTNFQTCGRIIVPNGARLVAAHRVEAGRGIEVHGHFRANQAISVEPTIIHANAVWNGNLKTSSVIIEPGAIIESGYFEVIGRASTPVEVPRRLKSKDSPPTIVPAD